MELLDRDELEAALAAGAITRDQRDAAWREAERVLTEIRLGAFPPFLRTAEYLARSDPGGRARGAGS